MSNTVGCPAPTSDDPISSTVTDLSELYRTKLTDDLQLTGTFLRHPAAAFNTGNRLSHDIELPDAPGTIAHIKTRRIRLPRALVRQLACRDAEYLIFDGEPIYLCELTVTFRRRTLTRTPVSHSGQQQARAIAEAMHLARFAHNIHDCSPHSATGPYRFCWVSTRSGCVLTSPAELYEEPDRAA